MQRLGMRTLGLALLATALVGCGDMNDLADSDSEPPAGANNNGGGGGEFDGMVVDKGRAFNTGGNSPAPNANSPAPQPAQPAQPTAQSIPLVEAKLVDKQQEMAKNPALKVVDGQAQGGDPLSFAASAYMNLPQRINALNFQNTARQMEALNGGDPLTLQQFRDLMKQTQAEFKQLPPYRMYGYDSKTGQVVILEDSALKKQIYEEKGIPLEE